MFSELAHHETILPLIPTLIGSVTLAATYIAWACRSWARDIFDAITYALTRGRND